MPVDRRQFLQDSATLAASMAALQATTSRAADETSPKADKKKVGANDTVRLAVIGVRGRGREHIRGFTRLDDVRITTICDVDRNVIEKPMKRA